MDLIEERGDAFVIDTTWKFSSLPAGFLPRLEPFEWNKELPGECGERTKKVENNADL